VSTIEVLRAATVLPVQCFGLDNRGIIEAGKRADLLLLADDPIKDIHATRSIQKVCCCGSEISV
jgi:imidazolonepropionase-like amidohydrolase